MPQLQPVYKRGIQNAILEIINDESYKNSARKIAELINDEPMTGLEKSIWWTEYVIRHRGAKHLRNPASDIPFYQYYLLDVAGFLILSAVIVLFLTVKILKKSAQYFISVTENGSSSKLKNQ
ncbi:hypothetical protein JTB14_024282 [Gonioctena quinquepunctata]|nr:hypothetical protein JTB14_024282 [Gonioctena quinquepunctata]